ncbi:MAG: hypothetical protein Q8K45_05455 [Rubrivivax sp.]|nr:hypothetical protein [Rubrivivax sp.]
MSGVLSAALGGSACRPRSSAAAADTTTIDHVLDCVAGFHINESDARRAGARLASVHGLLPTQLLLLQPADAAWLPFLRQRRHWARGTDAEGQTWLGDRWLLAASGAMLAGLISAFGLMVDGGLGLGLGEGWELTVCGVAVGLGTLAGYVLATLAGQSPQYRRFNTIIRAQLAGGRWVVLAHDLPWERQAEVVKLVREQGQDWCAVASARRWL